MTVAKYCGLAWINFLHSTVAGLFAVLLSACGPEPQVTEGRALPICPRTNRSFSVQQLIDIAAFEEMTDMRIEGRCPKRYRTLEEFYRDNPHCCDIDLRHTLFNEPITSRYVGEHGYLIGHVEVHHFCGSNNRDVGMFMRGYADITSCGVITDETESPDGPNFAGRFPQFANDGDKR